MLPRARRPIEATDRWCYNGRTLCVHSRVQKSITKPTATTNSTMFDSGSTSSNGHYRTCEGYTVVVSDSFVQGMFSEFSLRIRMCSDLVLPVSDHHGFVVSDRCILCWELLASPWTSTRIRQVLYHTSFDLYVRVLPSPSRMWDSCDCSVYMLTNTPRPSLALALLLYPVFNTDTKTFRDKS